MNDVNIISIFGLVVLALIFFVHLCTNKIVAEENKLDKEYEELSNEDLIELMEEARKSGDALKDWESIRRVLRKRGINTP